MTKEVRLKILGVEYTISTQADKEYAERVASYVNSKCHEAQRSLGSTSQTTIFALAALNIASDHLKLKESYELMIDQIESNHRKLAFLVQ